MTVAGVQRSPKSGDPFELARFLEAQGATYETALVELAAGRKRSHWMWFVFPQLAGLGLSPMARFYAIGGLEEARAYLAHPLLGLRLVGTTRTVLGIDGLSLGEIFGSPDDLKFRSSMTLFDCAAEGGEAAFREALHRFCGGERDRRTLELLGKSS